METELRFYKVKAFWGWRAGSTAHDERVRITEQ